MQVTDICRMNIQHSDYVFSMPVFILLTRIDWLTDPQNPLVLKDH